MHNIKEILDKFIQIKEVKAIAIGGSTIAKTFDKTSDIDIYVFSETEIPINKREEIIKPISSKYEIGEHYFGEGDEFLYDEAGVVLDVMYWNTKWFEDVVQNVWFNHYPSNGYSTCFLYTLNNFNIIYDPDNWLKSLQDKIKTEYPEELQKNIIQRNLMLLKEKPFASYYEQIEKALNRGDTNSVNHRIAAFLASYFDIILAKNKLLHPGEKRLVQYCKNNCTILPANFEENINRLLAQPNKNTLSILNEMVVNLKNIL